MERLPEKLTPDEIEQIERCSMRSLWIAVRDFAHDAWAFFQQSKDDPKDIAEDATRELLDRLGGFAVPQRIFGNVDYRKARYMILPDLAVRQALFVDSKAEKSASSATLQMSQISLSIKQARSGDVKDIPGLLQPIQYYQGYAYLSTTLVTHYHYSASEGDRDGRDRPPYTLHKITLAAVPSGFLQDRYNPHEADTIWIAGRNAPTRGETFRVRLSFNRLKQKASWRIQTIDFDSTGQTNPNWED